MEVFENFAISLIANNFPTVKEAVSHFGMFKRTGGRVLFHE